MEYTFSSTICFLGGFGPKKQIVEKKEEVVERFSGSKRKWQIVEITFASCGKSFCKSWKSRLQVVENLLREMIKAENFRLRRSFSKVISA